MVRTVAGLRPRTIAAAAGGLVVLYATAGVLDTLDHLPLVPGVLKLVGLGASLWLWGRWDMLACCVLVPFHDAYDVPFL